MMTKRNFKEIADAIKNADTKKEIINNLVSVLREENPRFNTYTFRKACGLTDEECGY